MPSLINHGACDTGKGGSGLLELRLARRKTNNRYIIKSESELKFATTQAGDYVWHTNY